MSNGTQAQYVVQSDLKGTIPSSIVNMVSSNQPMVLANICKALETQKTPLFKSGVLSSKKFGYGDFKAAAKYEGPSANAALAGGGAASATAAPTKSSLKPSGSMAKSGGGLSLDSKSACPSSSGGEVSTTGSRGNLYLLFFPLVLYYISGTDYRALGFLIGLVISMRYLLRQQLGDAKIVLASNMGQVLFICFDYSCSCFVP